MSAAKPELRGASFIWAKSQEEFDALVALGWRVADQRATHHAFHACLMRWHGEGEPKTKKE